MSVLPPKYDHDQIQIRRIRKKSSAIIASAIILGIHCKHNIQLFVTRDGNHEVLFEQLHPV